MEPVSDPRVYSNRYQVTHLIARGGMAMVYRAQDLLLNRPVALKILYPELSADPLFVERFRREAQAAANLSHPNIVPVFDWGEDEGTYFIVMELVDGTSLAELLRGSRTLTPSRSAQLVAQVAAALGYAHRNGVVHRDVKPGNILITSDGQVKVTDFGIAQAVSSEDHLAEAGSVMGTATYFSPEQAEGAAVDGRSDVYSLGVVLYEMVAGRPPFIGDTPLAVSSQHVHNAVEPPSHLNPAIPSDLEAIIMESLAKSPEQRYQTADELRADLLRFSEGQPVRAAQRDVAFFGADATRAVSAVAPGERTRAVPVMTGPRTDIRRRRRNPTGTIIVVLVILLALGGLAYFYLAKQSATTMPDVVGEQVAAATTQLRADGLTVGPTRLISSTKPQGTVLITVPKAGATIHKGETVIIRVSLGKTTVQVTVPSVVGKTLPVAENLLNLAKLSFKPNFTTTAPAGATPDVVLSQTPVGGTKVQSGQEVILTILSPTTKFGVPSLAGDTTIQATSVIVQYGLSVSPTTSQVCSNTIKQGFVVSTLPTSGSLVIAGTSIELVTSSGYCNVYVPNVSGGNGALGQTQTDATATLKAQGLVAAFTPADPTTCTPEQVGTVISQSVPGGSPAPYDSTITLTICQSSSAPPTTTTTTTGP